MNMKSKKTIQRLENEKGIALIMVLIIATVLLIMMAGLIYMMTSGTQISGFQKRYKTALEASFGGAQIAYQIVGFRGDTTSTDILAADLSSLNLTITNPSVSTSSCKTLASDATCTALGSYYGMAAKLNLPTYCWSGCDSSQSIDPPNSATYDVTLQLPGVSSPYNVYAKVVDTVLGNTGADEGLQATGVVSSNTSKVMSVPYLYTIELDAENSANPSERAKLSILYEY